MNEHNATEQAYKNGYKKGRADAIKEFAERIKTIIEKHYLIRGFDCVIDTLVQEMRDEE